MSSQPMSGQGSQQQQPSQQASTTGASSGSQGGSLAREGPTSYGMPSIFRGGPFEMLRRLDEDMDRLFDEFWGGGGGRRFLRGGARAPSDMPTLWVPQVEMCQQGGKFHVYADLPGMKKDDVKVSIEGDAITLQGERRANAEEGGQQGGYWRSERSYGSFYRTIPLPEGIDTQTAEASFRDGVLDICFDAPRQTDRARQLEIKDGGGTTSGGSSSGGAASGGRTTASGTSGTSTGSAGKTSAG